MAVDTSISTEEFWLFGYGSLIWKPPPHFDQRIPGYVTGYVRRFWQASQDHRGTPDKPGRVVTLIERSFWETLSDPHPSASSDKVWGTAYRIETAKVAEVKEYLDIREINGYTIHYTDFHPADASPMIKTLVYIGTPDNDQFMGPQDPERLAEHIYRSKGPSGPNKDYLLSLETALDGLSPESGDYHVKDLADRLKKISEATGGVSRGKEALDHELKKVDSTDEQEETEKRIL
ncbi:Glutathione-specific gamma-glutamylcyclotransferase [Lachnellula hyalina]|uniref:glutathione-specific gamma-glutamylcyclotransferase n=1 Tax=Lachnellula hyalina TaxID=1316788 RepID=A0A8H8R5L0_9HELO|nr:Glutathione-specific gamma-glutamylcyclotransferase [Lachnellula hyalina]TVY28056.1 Glutathione-specific gamma-glutamylcyclotransferase [Lachnellula hyalina]